MEKIIFANPELFYLLLILVPIVAWYIWKNRSNDASIQTSSISGLESIPRSWKVYGRHLIFILNCSAIALAISALARPQSKSSWENSTTKGIDIAIALDISSSMLAQDFAPNRLEASKRVAQKFVTGRESDRIGLIVFGGESFTQCPITTDKATLLNLFKDVESGMIEDGTAIGSGLATSVSRLKESKAASKVVILLTDGENNRGEIAPETAAEIAKTFGIKVYTIGVGTYGTAPMPVQTPFGMQTRDVPVKIDEKTLQKISDITGGEYFRATDEKALENVYKEIDLLEKSEIDTEQFSRKEEKFHIYGLGALLALLLSMLLRQTIFRSIP